MRTDMTKLIISFRNFAKPPKISQLNYYPLGINYVSGEELSNDFQYGKFFLRI